MFQSPATYSKHSKTTVKVIKTLKKCWACLTVHFIPFVHVSFFYSYGSSSHSLPVIVFICQFTCLSLIIAYSINAYHTLQYVYMAAWFSLQNSNYIQEQPKKSQLSNGAIHRYRSYYELSGESGENITKFQVNAEYTNLQCLIDERLLLQTVSYLHILLYMSPVGYLALNFSNFMHATQDKRSIFMILKNYYVA